MNAKMTVIIRQRKLFEKIIRSRVFTIRIRR